MRLNKEQYRAAMHIGGPMLVLAGPGSGKTHLLVERIRILIEDAQIRPENILVITFSKKAAREMQARFNQRTKDRSYPVTFGTFHAVFYNILKDFDPATNTLITEEQKNEYIRRAVIMTKAASGLCDDGDIESLAGLISSYRNFGDDYFEQSYEGRQMDADERTDLVAVCRLYEKMCIDNRVLDFDDMIIRCRDILYKHEGLLRKWQDRYRYILVDEFQDINDCQYDVLRLIAKDSKNVFAVGEENTYVVNFGNEVKGQSRFQKQLLEMCARCIHTGGAHIRVINDRIFELGQE